MVEDKINDDLVKIIERSEVYNNMCYHLANNKGSQGLIEDQNNNNICSLKAQDRKIQKIRQFL